MKSLCLYPAAVPVLLHCATCLSLSRAGSKSLCLYPAAVLVLLHCAMCLSLFHADSKEHPRSSSCSTSCTSSRHRLCCPHNRSHLRPVCRVQAHRDALHPFSCVPCGKAHALATILWPREYVVDSCQNLFGDGSAANSVPCHVDVAPEDITRSRTGSHNGST